MTFLLAEGVRAGRHLALLEAAQVGHLAVLEALHAHGCSLEAYVIAKAAAAGGHLAMVVWAVETLGATVASIDPNDAAMSGSVELLSWLHERGCVWREGTLGAAAESGCA